MYQSDSQVQVKGAYKFPPTSSGLQAHRLYRTPEKQFIRTLPQSERVPPENAVTIQHRLHLLHFPRHLGDSSIRYETVHLYIFIARHRQMLLAKTSWLGPVGVRF